jgi:hypothetical protein
MSNLPVIRIVTALLSFAMLAGCTATSSGPGSSRMDSLFADPSKYILYGCPQLAVARKPLLLRERELRLLIEKADRDPVGSVIGVAAYRSEYLSVRGEIKVIDDAAVNKNCAPVAPAGPRQSGVIQR